LDAAQRTRRQIAHYPLAAINAFADLFGGIDAGPDLAPRAKAGL
jgi:hypothetical protein